MDATDEVAAVATSKSARGALDPASRPLASDDVAESSFSESDSGLEDHVQNDGRDSADGTSLRTRREHTSNTTMRTPASKGPIPQDPDPSLGPTRHESEAATTRKRKRTSSPPWIFPTAENTTLKAADGRRISARVNVSTPARNDNEEIRARSSSLSTARSRAPSPPWRKFGAEGPTSLVVNGKRKSGRVNKELVDPPHPKRTSPRSKKQATTSHGLPSTGRLTNGNESRSGNMSSKKSEPESSRSSSSSEHIAKLRAQIHALQPTRSFRSPEHNHNHKRKTSNDAPTQTNSSSPSPIARKLPRLSATLPDQHRPSPTIKLRFTGARHIVPHPHPNAKAPSPTRPPSLSIYQLIEQLELNEIQQPYSENERGPPDMAWFLQRADKQAAEEGSMRRNILEEARPGGKLSREKLSLFQDADRQAEPPKQHGHSDHLVAHALYLRHLQIREKAQHRQTAKKVAHEAVEFWKAMRGPTEEDIREQENRIFRLVHKQVVVDMRAKWDMVAAHVQQERLRQWEAVEELKRQQRLQEKLIWSENMVARQRGEAGDSDVDMDEDSIGDVMGSESEEEDDETEEENMTESSSDDESREDGEMGEDDLAAYLAQREPEPIDKMKDDNYGDADDDIDTENGTHDISMDETEAIESGTQFGAGDEYVATADGLRSETEDDEGGDSAIRSEGNTPMPDAVSHVDNQLTIELQTATHGRRSRRSSASPIDEGEQEESHLSSDESTDMDSEDYDSDEDMSSTGDEADGDDEDVGSGQADSDDGQAPKSGLLGFFSSNDIKGFGLPTPSMSAEGDEQEKNTEPAAEERSDRQADADALHKTVHSKEKATNEPGGTVYSKLVFEQSAQSIPEAPELTVPNSAPDSPAPQASEDDSLSHLVPAPSLLRGKLRSYQHAGLDWLASLYRNGTNGILADEMGLGKTIQTIALLAHLAEEHECWDAHLVIVPTSVVLNWVTEFQKFLPGFRVLGYYGSAEERQAKRRGWVNDPHHIKEKRGYNVVITSYNVAMQDINAIRNVPWHYLVLDEAHNIRNFNSQRWQVLIRLRTQARLLLTGTPLQNSLTELWSLLTFLTAGDDDPAHGDLEEFLSHWKEPVKEIFDRGAQSLSNEAQRVVDQLHVSLRPFLLRRLKSEVEKDLPKKTESVVVCKLSKRQRQLYQDYMGLADTKRSLTQGNAVTAGKVLLSLRRVCNHPDLFDPRPIQTSFGMEQSALEPFEAKENLVRKLLGIQQGTPAALLITGNETRRSYMSRRSKQLSATSQLQREAKELETSLGMFQPDVTTISGCQALQRHRVRQKKLERLRSCIRSSEDSVRDSPIYGLEMRELLTVRNGRPYRVIISRRPLTKQLRAWPALGRHPLRFGSGDHPSDFALSKYSTLQQSVQTCSGYAERLHDAITRFAFVTPPATAPVLNFSIPLRTQELFRASISYPIESDYAHEARIRTSIAFPDRRLLIYDSGKLQRLSRLLRELQSKGSRSLIFSQMTGTLNILEQFLSLLNLPYLRLDGSTPVERRQLYAAEFNRPDSKYQCMILSSRAGGVGLNLIGASSVIFYDLDWNPQMDRQCMDRAHRIGQVRDVEVYKMVSEKTIEENILRRANQKSLLDQTVIQEGHFTTEYQQRRNANWDAGDEDDAEREDDDVAAAIDRFLGGGEKATTQAIESVEDREDVQAAQQARKEEHQDDADFADRSSKGPSVPPTPGHMPGDENDEDRRGHVDHYMIRQMERLLQDVPFIPPVTRKPDKQGREASQRSKKRKR